MDTWNNGNEVPRLDLRSSITPGQQIQKFDHTRTANPCDWLPCCRAAFPLVGCPHSLVNFHLSFSVYQQPPIWEPPSHYSMAVLVSGSDHWSGLFHFISLSWVLSCLQLSLSWAHIWTDPMSVAGEMTGIAQHYYNNQKISLCQTIIVKMGTSLLLLQCFVGRGEKGVFIKDMCRTLGH